MIEKEIMFLSIRFIKTFGILYYAKKLYMEFFYHNHNIFVFNPFLAFVLKTYYKDIKFLSSQNIIEQYKELLEHSGILLQKCWPQIKPT